MRSIDVQEKPRTLIQELVRPKDLERSTYGLRVYALLYGVRFGNFLRAHQVGELQLKERRKSLLPEESMLVWTHGEPDCCFAASSDVHAAHLLLSYVQTKQTRSLLANQ
ncbi:hypothetical protein VTO42DRAFT_8595 [Malbranchea cinnamomea]